MKKLVLFIMILILNTFLFSCTTDSIDSTESLYTDQMATEGEDGQVEQDPDEEDSDENSNQSSSGN
ncbi:hypothetical protein GTQ40_13500 [Flavobacteriaceae bacterium R38]|nr:hypothetical protein [Flavobacteriaceae bacterium R38]